VDRAIGARSADARGRRGGACGETGDFGGRSSDAVALGGVSRCAPACLSRGRARGVRDLAESARVSSRGPQARGACERRVVSLPSDLLARVRRCHPAPAVVAARSTSPCSSSIARDVAALQASPRVHGTAAITSTFRGRVFEVAELHGTTIMLRCSFAGSVASTVDARSATRALQSMSAPKDRKRAASRSARFRSASARSCSASARRFSASARSAPVWTRVPSSLHQRSHSASSPS